MAIPFNLPSDEDTENNYRSMDELLMQLYHVLRQILLHDNTHLERNNARPTPPTTAAAAPTVAAAAAPTVAAAAVASPRLPLPDLVQSTAPSTPSRPARQRPTSTTTTPTTPTTLRSPSHPLPPPRRGRRRRSQQQHPYPRIGDVEQAKNIDAPDCAEVMTYYQYSTTTTSASPLRDQSLPDLLLPSPKSQPSLPKVEMRDNWSQVGEDLRHIADEFHASLQDTERSKGPTSEAEKGASLLSLLVPAPFSGSLWMAVMFLLGWGVLQKSGR